ncbi:S41 family peptidase [Sphingomonas sp.]|uniref:S41 family peptidase n=1 Tax=Sphingomonas sp. TaxID=28214 RepID=UPI0025FD6E12|nr:S41 family peptidase [Sphingomonas sp.]
MERRAFLGLSAAAIAALGSGAALAQATDTGLAGAVAKLADLLETGYVYPDTGKKYAAMLRQKLAAGGYAAVSDPVALGQQLSADLNAVSSDRHLRIVPEAMAGGGGPRRVVVGGPAPGAGSGPQPIRRVSLEDAGWVAKGVAYLRYTGFTGDPATVAATADFMKTHATAKSLIIDCRYNGGGGIDEMNAIFPYLFAKETVLVQMQMAQSVAKARGGTPFDDDKFVRDVPAPVGLIGREHYAVPGTETGLFGAKVFYLTSGRTASAAEHLALAFRHTRRAIQIGETTAGANHFGDFVPIGAGLVVFLPVGRTIDPDTGKDWEGTGIVPDIAVAPALALEEALRRAGAL